MLLWCSGVGRTAVVVQTAYVAYAYAVGVMPKAVGTCLFQRPAAFNGPIYQYHIVVAYHAVSLFTVPAVYIPGCKRLPHTGGRAVDYYFGYCSHTLFFKTTSPQDYKTASFFKTTSPRDYKTASGYRTTCCLIVSLSCCLVDTLSRCLVVLLSRCLVDTLSR